MSVIIKNEMFIKIQLFSFHFPPALSHAMSHPLSQIYLLHRRGFPYHVHFFLFDQPKLLLLLSKVLHIIFRCCCRCFTATQLQAIRHDIAVEHIRRIFLPDVNYTFFSLSLLAALLLIIFSFSYAIHTSEMENY